MSTNQTQLNNYFSQHWSSTNNWTITNEANIASMIKEFEHVLDVGCGYNPFKQYLGDKLYAFDPAINSGNELCSLEDFDAEGDQWDLVLCMGSINFGDEDHIASQIEKVVSFVKPGGRILWRQNPGNADHDNEECKLVPFFPWTKEHNYAYAARFGCRVVDFEVDKHKTNSEKVRLYAEWIKR